MFDRFDRDEDLLSLEQLAAAAAAARGDVLEPIDAADWRPGVESNVAGR